eukprot:12086198-Heterocapsa_arctica.AAC.1
MSSVRPSNSESQHTRCTDEAQTWTGNDEFAGRPARPRSPRSGATGRGPHVGVQSKCAGRPGSEDQEETH